MVRTVSALIAVAVAAVVLSACTVKKTDRPALTGPSELALSLNLTANPDILTQDGTSQSRIVILARDANGAPVKGLPLHVEFTANVPLLVAGSLSSQDVSTGTDGRATVAYTSPPLPATNQDQGIIITVLVTPTGTDFTNATPRSVAIRLVPPSVVTPGPVASFSFTPTVPVTNSQISFDGSSSRSPSGTIVAWGWDFGDGVTATGPSVQHVFRAKGTYKVTLIVGDNTGRTSVASSQTIVVDDPTPPTADFVVSGALTAGTTVFFNAVTSKAGYGRSITNYAWDFGNGTSARGVTATATYAAAGTYTVTLVVSDDVGQTASKSSTVTIK